MKYDVAAYDDSYNSIVESFGYSNPGMIESASNIVGMYWNGPGIYEVRSGRNNGMTISNSPGVLGTTIYELMLKEGLDITARRIRIKS